MAYDETLASRVREILTSLGGFSEKKMFGGLCFMVRGNMCCGVLKDDLVLRLKPERTLELLNRPHTRPMDFTGRPMKGFLFIGGGGLRTNRQLRDWVSMSLSFAQDLPRKPVRRLPSRRSTSVQAERQRG